MRVRARILFPTALSGADPANRLSPKTVNHPSLALCPLAFECLYRLSERARHCPGASPGERSRRRWPRRPAARRCVLPAMPQSSDFMDIDDDLTFYGVPTFSVSPGNQKDAASAGRAAKPLGADRRAAPSALARIRQLHPRSLARHLARSPRPRRTQRYSANNPHLAGRC
jgi:hypothetical protein